MNDEAGSRSNEKGGNSPSSLQFDKAEFGGGPEESSAPEGGQPLVCSITKEPITGEYYELNGDVVSPKALEARRAEYEKGGRFGRLFRSLVFGGAAMIVCAAAWSGIRAVTGLELGIVAVAAGFIVGSAVNAGCRKRGGWLYRPLAVLLTYGAISLSAAPLIYKELSSEEAEGKIDEAIQTPTNKGSVNMADQIEKDNQEYQSMMEKANKEIEKEKAARGIKNENGETSVGMSVDESRGKIVGMTENEGSKNEARDDSEVRAVKRKLFILIMTIIFMIVYPVLILKTSAVIFLINMFSLWEAFRLSAGTPMKVQGPFLAPSGAVGGAAGVHPEMIAAVEGEGAPGSGRGGAIGGISE